ncbi:MAG: hypothetical protein ACPGRX_03400 [Bdellovibrionales bacterium]
MKRLDPIETFRNAFEKALNESDAAKRNRKVTDLAAEAKRRAEKIAPLAERHMKRYKEYESAASAAGRAAGVLLAARPPSQEQQDAAKQANTAKSAAKVRVDAASEAMNVSCSLINLSTASKAAAFVRLMQEQPELIAPPRDLDLS